MILCHLRTHRNHNPPSKNLHLLDWKQPISNKGRHQTRSPTGGVTNYQVQLNCAKRLFQVHAKVRPRLCQGHAKTIKSTTYQDYHIHTNFKFILSSLYSVLFQMIVLHKVSCSVLYSLLPTLCHHHARILTLSVSFITVYLSDH